MSRFRMILLYACVATSLALIFTFLAVLASSQKNSILLTQLSVVHLSTLGLCISVELLMGIKNNRKVDLSEAIRQRILDIKEVEKQFAIDFYKDAYFSWGKGVHGYSRRKILKYVPINEVNGDDLVRLYEFVLRSQESRMKVGYVHHFDTP